MLYSKNWQAFYIYLLELLVALDDIPKCAPEICELTVRARLQGEAVFP